jgi:oligopeptide/dipeptide ABC transporter ATP-binding protein
MSAPDKVVSTDPANEPVLVLEGIRVRYALGAGKWLHALRGIDLTLRRGETLAIVGESGSGKTTLVRVALNLFDLGARPTLEGRVRTEGQDVTALWGAGVRALRRRAQLVFQDPYASLDPRMRVGDIIAEPLIIHRLGGKRARSARVLELLAQVGLSAEIAHRFPSALSGGQRQRVGIARALAVDPDLLVLDEPLSALDVSVQAQIINLLVELRAQRGLTYLLVAHDLRLVRYLATSVAVMYLGRIVESGPVAEVLARPRHPYTQLLVRSSPSLEPGRIGPAAERDSERPSPLSPPAGCAFAERCPLARERCRQELPELEAKGSVAATVACFAVGDWA